MNKLFCLMGNALLVEADPETGCGRVTRGSDIDLASPMQDGFDSLLLAMACAGIDLTSPAMTEAIQTAHDAMANHAEDAEWSLDEVEWNSGEDPASADANQGYIRIAGADYHVEIMAVVPEGHDEHVEGDQTLMDFAYENRLGALREFDEGWGVNYQTSQWRGREWFILIYPFQS